MNLQFQYSNIWPRVSLWSFLFLVIASGLPQSCLGQPLPALALVNQAQVDSQGVFLDQLVPANSLAGLPRIRLAEAPAFGKAIVLTRAQIQTAAYEAVPDLTNRGWSGMDRVRITRRARVLYEAEIRELLKSTLQHDYVRDQGELELRFSRPWNAAVVPDEVLELKIIDLPITGVTANFIARFELRASKEVVGTWQAVVQARIWKEVWVAAAPLKRGQLLGSNDMVRDRRDILALRDSLASLTEGLSYEMTDNLNAGAPISTHSIRARPLVHRGDVVEALVQDGTLSISLKVEVLEEGAFGQSIRIRNPQTKREFRGKVQNEQTILVAL